MQNEKEPKRLERWLYKNMSQVNTPYDGPYVSDLNVEFENLDDADDLMKKIKRAGFRFTVDQFREESQIQNEENRFSRQFNKVVIERFNDNSVERYQKK